MPIPAEMLREILYEYLGQPGLGQQQAPPHPLGIGGAPPVALSPFEQPSPVPSIEQFAAAKPSKEDELRALGVDPYAKGEIWVAPPEQKKRPSALETLFGITKDKTPAENFLAVLDSPIAEQVRAFGRAHVRDPFAMQQQAFANQRKLQGVEQERGLQQLMSQLGLLQQQQAGAVGLQEARHAHAEKMAEIKFGQTLKTEAVKTALEVLKAQQLAQLPPSSKEQAEENRIRAQTGLIEMQQGLTMLKAMMAIAPPESQPDFAKLVNAYSNIMENWVFIQRNPLAAEMAVEMLKHIGEEMQVLRPTRETPPAEKKGPESPLSIKSIREKPKAQ
jgi:hypothetical protein